MRYMSNPEFPLKLSVENCAKIYTKGPLNCQTTKICKQINDKRGFLLAHTYLLT